MTSKAALRVTHTRIPLSLIALAIISLVAVQIGTNIRIYADESAATLMDRAPFYLVIGVGAVLLAHQPHALIRWKTLTACGLYFVYLSAVLTLTTDASLLPYVLPNYGIIAWVLLGMAVHVAIATLERRILHAGARSIWRWVIWIPSLSLAFLFLSLREFTLRPGRVDSYQFPADNLIVLLLFGLLALDRWGLACQSRSGRAAALPALSFLALSTVLTYLVSRMDSTAIVAVWSALTVALIWRFGISQGWKSAALFAAVLFAVISMVPESHFFEDFIAETRFEELQRGSGILELSSLTSRLDILPTFEKQFSVSPLFGHMEAEVVSGAGAGNWVHSLPLSALTHTGLIGTLLLCSAILFAAGVGRRPDHGFFPVLMFGLILVFATTFAFFTWIPFWFMIGYLAIRTSPKES